MPTLRGPGKRAIDKTGNLSGRCLGDAHTVATYMSESPAQLSLHSPAKVNLMLSVHPRRADGFHELTSLIVPLDFGDTLHVGLRDACDQLTCSDPAVPIGAQNLVLRAAVCFRERLGRAVYFEFHLDKRIPMGAGLGGGSGNAVVALKGMNSLLGDPLPLIVLYELAAQLGSDCPFFVEQQPAIMRGRGERLEALPEAVAARLRGQGILLFQPEFPVATGWAYAQLVEGAPDSYKRRKLRMNVLMLIRTGRSLQHAVQFF